MEVTHMVRSKEPTGLFMMSESVASVLACPDCREKLVVSEIRCDCTKCGRSFPVVEGVPFLLPQGSAMFADRSDNLFRRMDGEYRHTPGWIKSAKTILSGGLHFGQKHFDTIVQKSASSGIILNVGGGPTRERPQFTNLNISNFPNVDVVGDAHMLPVLSNSVAGVVCCAVLEHVREPIRCVNEMLRVLMPGGHVYIEIPFMQHFHGYPDDYQRWTLHGLRYLMRMFQEVEAGVILGPGASLIEVFDSYLTLPFKNQIAIYAIKGFLRVCLLPVKYLDIIMAKTPAAHTLASGLFFLGQKVR